MVPAEENTTSRKVQEYIHLALSYDGKFIVLVEDTEIAVVDVEASKVIARKQWSGVRKAMFNPTNSAQIVAMCKEEVLVIAVERSGPLTSLNSK